MNILAFGAHPDDIEYGCGGMLAKYAQRGHSVYMFVASDGALGGDPEVRRREQEEAARILGVREVFWGDYQDTEVPLTRELIVRLESVIRQVEPRMIFVNSPDDTHQDHRHLAQSAMSATRYIPNFLFYEVPSTVNFTPNCYTDIADVLGREAGRSRGAPVAGDEDQHRGPVDPRAGAIVRELPGHPGAGQVRGGLSVGPTALEPLTLPLR